MSKQIIFKISKAGKVTTEAVGFDGCGCTDATAPYETKLSGTGENTRVLKPEWSNQTTDDQQTQQQSW